MRTTVCEQAYLPCCSSNEVMLLTQAHVANLRGTRQKAIRLQERRCSTSLLLAFFPTLGVGLLDFKLNSSPRPVYSSLILGVPNPKVSLECPTLECPGVPNPSFSLECPTPESPWSAQPQSVPECLPALECPRLLACPTPESPNRLPESLPLRAPESPWCPTPRVPNPSCLTQSLLERPTPECPRSARPQSVPGAAQPQSISTKDVRSKIVFFLGFTGTSRNSGY